MTGSIALDVVIGLVFIYLLYSLFATIIVELIAVRLSFRAHDLREAINRMLMDEPSKEKRSWRDMISKWMKRNPNLGEEIKWFYAHQEIKYLGKKAEKHPSAIKAQNFAKVVIDRLKESGKEGTTNLEKIKLGLGNTINMTIDNRILGKETAEYIRSVLDDCQNDLDKFKEKIERWFDQTMEHAGEWYKQRIQRFLLVIGFLIAWWFNVDTFKIVKILSKDEDAREKMVQLASAFIEDGKYERYTAALQQGEKDSLIDSVTLKTYQAKIDTLININKELKGDLNEANDVLGLGSWLPDVIVVGKDGTVTNPSWVEYRIAKCVFKENTLSSPGKKKVTFFDKVPYLLLLPFYHFLGYLVTALAISLGAPFWFDMLSKLMKLRGNVKSAEPTAAATAPENAKPIKG